MPAALSSPSAPYDFNQPAALRYLPDDLEEISGLTLIDDRTLAAIQDEDGEVFFIDWETGDVSDSPKFEGDDDYEGIERVGDRLYVLRSDGTLFEIEGWRGDDLEVDRHKTDLDEDQDTEGLAYDALANRLLIACKEDPGKRLKDVRAIYAFDLAEQELRDEAVFAIPLAAFGSEGEAFKPSALAVHPGTGQIYVVSSVHKVIVVLERDGTMAAVWPLPEGLLPQPEGLAFRSNGDLFIASEGQGARGRIALYTYRPPGGP